MYKESSVEYLHKDLGGKKTPKLHLSISWKVQSQEEKKMECSLVQHQGSGVIVRTWNLSNLIALAPSQDKLRATPSSLPEPNGFTAISRHQYGTLFSVLLHTGISLWKKKALILLILTVMETSTSAPKSLCHLLFQNGEFLCLQAKLVAPPPRCASLRKCPSAAAARSSCSEQRLRNSHLTAQHVSQRSTVWAEASLSAPTHSPVVMATASPELQALTILPSGLVWAQQVLQAPTRTAGLPGALQRRHKHKPVLTQQRRQSQATVHLSSPSLEHPWGLPRAPWRWEWAGTFPDVRKVRAAIQVTKVLLQVHICPEENALLTLLCNCVRDSHYLTHRKILLQIVTAFYRHLVVS